MRAVTRLFARRNSCRTSFLGSQIIARQTQTSPDIHRPNSSRLSVKEKVRKPPFAKNLFVGVFDQDALAFPESLDLDVWNELNALSESVEAALWSEGSSTLGKDIEVLTNFKLLGMLLPGKHGGLDMTTTECLRLAEVIGRKPSLSLLLEINHTIFAKTIEKFGSTKQKDYYLSKIASGEIFGAYAVSESTSGYDPACVHTSVVENKDGSWKLNGEKLWVVTPPIGDTHFLVVAKINDLNHPDIVVPNMAAFVVERNQTGVKLEPHTTLGLNDLPICRLSFKDVEVPNENMIGTLESGFDIAISNINSHKFFIPTSISTNLKRLLRLATEHIKPRKQLHDNVREHELIMKTLTEAAETIYVMDSMLYLTAGLVDMYEMDTTLESSINQAFCLGRGMSAASDLVNLVGGRAYDTSYPYSQIIMDLKGLSLAMPSAQMQNLFVGLVGVQHAGNFLTEEVSKRRNPFNFPGFIFKKMIDSSRQKSGNPKLTLNLFMMLHPSLKSSAEELERSVLRFQFAVETFLVRHGRECVKRQVELEKLAHVAVDLFAMTSVLARASRSYCTGVRFSDEEILFARAFCHKASTRVSDAVDYVLSGTSAGSMDILYFTLAAPVYQNTGYFVEHPLQRNIT